LKAIIQQTIRDKDETVIASSDGAVVVLDENEWSNIKETLRLFTDKQSLSDVAETLFQNEKYDWCLFIAHLVLEKTLKAFYVLVNSPKKIFIA
jgi:hypothetical protein